MFPGKRIPIIDANNGGSGVDYPQTLTKVHQGLTNVDTVITGHHTTTLTMNDLRQYAEFMTEFVSAVREGKKAGRTVDQIAESRKLSEKYAGYASPEAPRLRSNVQVTFDEIR